MPIEVNDLPPLTMTEPDTGGLSLFGDGPTAPIVPEQVAKQRADKAAFGLNSPQFNQEDIANSISSGLEDDLRKQSSETEQIKLQQERLGLLQQVAQSRPDRPLNDSERSVVMGLSQDDMMNPDTIWEKKFATATVNNALTLFPNTVLPDAVNEVGQDKAGQVMDVANYALANKEIAQKYVENLSAKWESRNWFSSTDTPQFGEQGPKVGALAETFIPFLSWAHTNDALEQAPNTSILPGNNIRDQLDYLYSLSPDQFQVQLKTALDDLETKNGLDAVNFASAVASYPSTSQFWDNAFTALDIASTVGPVVKGVAGVADVARASFGGEQKLAKGLSDVVKAAGARTLDPAEIVAASGDMDKAAILNASSYVQSVMDTADDAGRMKSLQKQIPTFFNPQRIVDGRPTNLGQNALNDIVGELGQTRDSLLGMFSPETSQVTRLTPDALAAGLSEVRNRVASQVPNLSDGILDIKHVTSDINPANVSSVDVFLGTPSGDLFATEQMARVYAARMYRLPLGSYEVEQQGFQYTLRVRKDIDETAPTVRQAMITTENTTPFSFGNMLFGSMRTAEDRLSNFQREARHVSTHGASDLQRRVMEAGQQIGNLSKASRNDLRRVWEVNQKDQSFYTTVADLEKNFSDTVGRYPSADETKAYFIGTQINDADWMGRNFSVYKQLSRMGVEDVEVGLANGQRLQPFKGKLVDDIPWSSKDDADILIYDSTTGSAKVVRKNSNPGRWKAEIEKYKKNGYKVVQVANPVDRPFAGLSGVGDRNVNFALVKQTRFNRLQWEQVPYKPGGHVIYPQPFFTKQAKVSRYGENTYYHGDAAIWSHTTEAEAREFSNSMEQARQLLKGIDSDGAVDAYERFVESHLPMTPEDFAHLFTNKSGGLKALLDIDTPVSYARSGQRVGDTEGFKSAFPNAINETADPYSLYGQIDKQFTQERAEMPLDSILKDGSENNPIISLQPSKVMDPLSAMHKGMASIIRSRYLQDYKIQAAESFVQEFHTLLDTPLNDLRANPMEALYNPKWVSSADPRKVASAKGVQRAAIELIGTQTDWGRQLDWMRNKLMDTVYTVSGQKGVEFMNSSRLMEIKDPIAFMRNIAFTTKLGLYNPVQYFLQAQSAAHAVALAGPKIGIPAVHAGYLLRIAGLNPNGAEWAAKVASKVGGYTAEEFKEMYSLMRKSGVANVAGETAWKDDVMDPQMFETGAAKFFDKSAIFFKEGERQQRLIAFAAAYKEWKIANPTKAASNAELGKILRRQNDMTLNMTRASNAMWQNGPLSVPSQFFSYNARMMEQMLGKRLSAPEKMRAFALYSLLYGIPKGIAAGVNLGVGGALAGAAVGGGLAAYTGGDVGRGIGVGAVVGLSPTVAAGLWPFSNDIRAYALRHGLPLDNKALQAVMEGIPSVVMTSMTGAHLNIGERFGPGGISYFHDALNGDLSSMELLLGASGSVMEDIFKTVTPLAMAASDVFKPDNEKYPLIPEDFLALAQNVSTANNAVKAYYGISAGKYFTRNGLEAVAETTPTEAILSAFLGTSPQSVSDTFLMLNDMKTQAAAQKEARKQVVRYLRLGSTASSQEDAVKYFKAAKMYSQMGNFRPDQTADMMKELGTSVDLYDRTRYNFWKNADPTTKPGIEGEYLNGEDK